MGLKLVSEKNMWLAPLVLGFIGGFYAYIKLKDTDKRRANKLLVFGIVWTIIYAIPKS